MTVWQCVYYVCEMVWKGLGIAYVHKLNVYAYYAFPIFLPSSRPLVFPSVYDLPDIQGQQNLLLQLTKKILAEEAEESVAPSLPSISPRSLPPLLGRVVVALFHSLYNKDSTSTFNPFKGWLKSLTQAAYSYVQKFGFPIMDEGSVVLVPAKV